MTLSPNIHIVKLFGLERSDVERKEHNIWIPISLSNRIFTPEHIHALILFALAYTKEKVLVLIPGRMHSINYRYFDGMRRSEALRKAFEDEDNYKKVVEDILHTLPQEQKNKVTIANYDDVCTTNHIQQKEVFFLAFAEQGEFYNALIDVMKDIIVNRGRTFTLSKAESLAVYALSELPFFVDGVQKISEKWVYTLAPYPGSGKLDELEMYIIEGKRFPQLTKQLRLQNKVGILDVAFV